MEILRKSWVFVFALCGFAACQNPETVTLKEAVLILPATPYRYVADTLNPSIPTLGRVLFYDARLSINNSISCASCHKQALAFADHVSLSEGFEGKLTFRNSMPIQNVKASPFFGFPSDGPIIDPFGSLSLFWDGREKLLDAMVLRPITNHVEMGITDMNALCVKLSAIQEYRGLFEKAYGTPEVDQFKISKALTEFVSSIVSNNSKFDQVNRGQRQLNALELIGLDLFFSKYDCNSCHQTQVLNGYQVGGGFVNIGLDQRYSDSGLSDVTGVAADDGKFKIPTLRNVALTAPYMHDGRFHTLDEVLEHYSEGIQDHPNLDLRLKGPDSAPLKMNISYHDKQAIIAFLNTLTDYDMLTDPKFSNPFRAQ